MLETFRCQGRFISDAADDRQAAASGCFVALLWAIQTADGQQMLVGQIEPGARGHQQCHPGGRAQDLARQILGSRPSASEERASGLPWSSKCSKLSNTSSICFERR